MTEKVLIPLKDLTTEGATLDQLRYWLKLLDITPEVSRRIAYLTLDQAEQVRRMISVVLAGTPPREAAAGISSKPERIQPLQVSPPDRMEALEHAVLKIAEEMHRSRTENAVQLSRILSEVRDLKQENAALRDQVMLLAPPKKDEMLFEVLKRQPEPAPVWSPQPKPDPLTGASWFTRQWVRLVDPARLRRWDS